MNESDGRELVLPETNDEIQYDHNHDGIDRRGFLKCMAWAGTGSVLRDAGRRAEVVCAWADSAARASMTRRAS